MKKSKWIVLLLIGILGPGCRETYNSAADRKAIQQLLLQERKAHFDRNVDLFISGFSDTLLSVNRGMVRHLTAEQNHKRIEPYFSSVEFIKWDDTADPVIRFSDDGSLAYAVVQKEVLLTYPDTNGQPFFDTTNYAWVSVYRKTNGVWKTECNASTQKQ